MQLLVRKLAEPVGLELGQIAQCLRVVTSVRKDFLSADTVACPTGSRRHGESNHSPESTTIWLTRLAAGVDYEALHVANSLAIRTEDGQALEVHHRVVDVSRIEITKP